MVCILNEQFIDEAHPFFSLHLMDILPLFCWNVINADAYVILSFIANINNLSINFMYYIVVFFSSFVALQHAVWPLVNDSQPRSFPLCFHFDKLIR